MSKKEPSPLEKISPDPQKLSQEYYEKSILPMLKTNQKEFQSCYSKYISLNPKILVGNIEFKFKIEDIGAISTVDIMNDDFKNVTLTICIINKLKKIRMDIPPMEINRSFDHKLHFQSKRKVKKIAKKPKTEKEVDGMTLLPKYLPMR